MIRDEIGGFHPAKFFACLLRCTEQEGAIILSDTPALEIKDVSEGKKSIVTNKELITASKVIITTNAYTGTKHQVGKFLR